MRYADRTRLHNDYPDLEVVLADEHSTSQLVALVSDGKTVELFATKRTSNSAGIWPPLSNAAVAGPLVSHSTKNPGTVTAWTIEGVNPEHALLCARSD